MKNIKCPIYLIKKHKMFHLQVQILKVEFKTSFPRMSFWIFHNQKRSSLQETNHSCPAPSAVPRLFLLTPVSQTAAVLLCMLKHNQSFPVLHSNGPNAVSDQEPGSLRPTRRTTCCRTSAERGLYQDRGQTGKRPRTAGSSVWKTCLFVCLFGQVWHLWFIRNSPLGVCWYGMEEAELLGDAESWD